VFRASIKLATKHGNSIVAVSKKTRLRLHTGEKLTTVLEGKDRAFAVEIRRSPARQYKKGSDG
jgi:hypothetical protein